MAEKLSIRIGLEGGEEITRQLEGIGAAGQKAFGDLAKSAEQVGGFKNIKPEEVTAKLREMGVTGADAIGKIQQAVQSAARLETLVNAISSVETGLKALAIAAIPVGAAIVAGMVASAKATISFAESINKVSDQAIKLGLSIEKFDQLRGSLEAAGISGKGVSTILESLGKAADTAALSKVTQAVKELQEASARGFGAQGTSQLKTLVDAAREVGPAADAARKALVDLGLVKVDPQGVAIIEGLPKTLAQLVGSTGDVTAGIAAFVQQLLEMGPGAQQSKLAVQEVSAAAGELVRALNTGQISADQFKQKMTGLITEEQAAKAGELGAAINRLQSAWDRFGSVSFAPVITAQINTVSSALKALQAVIEGLSWGSITRGVFAVGAALGNLNFGQQVLNGLAVIFPSITSAAEQAAAAIEKFVSSLVGITWDAISGAGVAAWNAIVTAVQGAGTAVTTFASQLGTIVWDAISGAGVAAWNALTGAIQGAIDAALRFLGLKSSGGAPKSAAAPGMAGGGLLGGRGTGTSDSNLAWLSRGEHIMPARAVAQPGVLAFLEALRRSGGDLRRVLDGMGRFALGGLVPRAIPAFASGGLAGGMSNVTIQFPGLPDISGLRASSDVVDQLHKAAALAQVRSGGRKPSRYS